MQIDQVVALILLGAGIGLVSSVITSLVQFWLHHHRHRQTQEQDQQRNHRQVAASTGAHVDMPPPSTNPRSRPLSREKVFAPVVVIGLVVFAFTCVYIIQGNFKAIITLFIELISAAIGLAVFFIVRNLFSRLLRAYDSR